MHPIIDRIRRTWRDLNDHNAEAEALNHAVDRFEVEMIHRRFARQNRSRTGY